VKKIEFYRHSIGDEEIGRVEDVLRSLFITTGDTVSEFEEQLARYLDLPHTIAVTSCTAAMQLALLAAGIGPGDEVITTPLTFIGTPNSVLMAGAIPVFADVERDTGNLDPRAVEAAVGERTRGILPVHLYGQMCDMDALGAIAKKHNLVIVEDAAHSLEAEWNGRKAGHHSDHACFSFYATKNITSGEGGAISVKEDERCDLLKKLRLHGLSTSAIDRYTKRFEQYDVDVFGWKYNMDNIHAAILIEQLKKVKDLHGKRNRIYKTYHYAFSGVDGIELHGTRREALHSHHLFTILVDPSKRFAIMKSLQDRGIGVSINFHPVHLMTYYRRRYGYREGSYPVAEEIGNRTISLPLYPRLTDEEIGYVIETTIDVVRNT
jgi:dTDP-4-amino-4,6-dideoxygalactose transaminase